MSNTSTLNMARILVAEDQSDLREMISFTLRLAGHQVVATNDGAEALQQAQDTQPDLIILDLHMPRLTGYEVCRQLKALEAFKDTPVIIISAKGSPDEIQAGLDAGASEYIRKPFPIDNLTSRVRALLGAD
jgi:DNA-binding response OmpR family regulator